MRCLLALSAVFCSVGAAASLAPGTTVAVFVSGPATPTPVLHAMQKEAESVLAPSGLRLAWVSSRQLQDSGVTGSLAIIRLQGQCRPLGRSHNDPVLASNGDTVLGQTHIVNGRMLPFADVLCDAVRTLVDQGLKTAPPGDRDTLFGRALGRVAAHELYHILTGATEHAHHGLSRPEQSSNELLAPRDAFSPEDEQRIADSVGGEASEPGVSGR